MDKLKGALVVISAPSGGGKTTLANELLSRIPKLRRSVSVTTRPQRPTEIANQDYIFVSDAQFDAYLKSNSFAEWASVHGYRYGTLLSTLTEGVAEGKIILLTIDVQGAKIIKKAVPSALCIFVAPPDFDSLEMRLRKRGTESESDIRKRLENARKEMAQASTFDFQVMNDSLERAALEIESIIKKQLRDSK